MGCGGPKLSTIKGTLVLPPNVKVEDNDHIVVEFTPAADTAKGGGATVTISNMSFETPASDRLAPGSYKVAVSAQPYPGSANAAQHKTQLAPINEKYGEKSPLKYDVTSDSVQTITVDLAEGKIVKK